MSELERKASMKSWAMTTASSAVMGFAALAMIPSAAYAQDDVEQIEESDEDESVAAVDDTIVVTGVRRSLATAQEIKRNADTIVDSITATDIGAFPDKSVAEALQRVAGVTVNRFAASDDTAHFSAEPSGVIVRGLNQVRSEFNGRDTFSANSSRGLSWNDISPELMAGVDTYKNQTAELIEGGIAGTINLRTRVPFDQQGQLVALSGNLNYGNLSNRVTPEVSGLYSNRWETGLGEFGIMANAAYSHVNTMTEGVQLYRAFRSEGVYTDDDRTVYIPERHRLGETRYDRKRTGVALAGQWQDFDRKWIATVQYMRSEYDNSWDEYRLSAKYGGDLTYQQPLDFTVTPDIAAGNGNVPQAALGTDLTFDDRGFLQTGTLVSDNTGWVGGPNQPQSSSNWSGYFAAIDFGPDDLGTPIFQPCVGDAWVPEADRCSAGDPGSQRGAPFLTYTRANVTENLTEDFGFNLKYAPTDRLRFNFDAQYIDASTDQYDIELAMQTYAQQRVDYTGDVPVLTLEQPPNMNFGPGYLAEAQSYSYSHVMDHLEESTGNETAVRGDVEYDLDTGWLSSVKAGVRYAEREQNIRDAGYNYQGMPVATWQARGHIYNINRFTPPEDFSLYAHRYPTIDGTEDRSPGINFNGYPTTISGRQWDSDFYGGGKLKGADTFYFFDMETLKDRELLASLMGAEALGFNVPGAGWDPICSNRGDRSEEIEGTCYRPVDQSDVIEETQAAYVQLNFGGPDAELFGVPFSGNVGVRYVRTELTSQGGIDNPLLAGENFADTNGNNFIDPEEQTFEGAQATCSDIPPEPVLDENDEPRLDEEGQPILRQPEVPRTLTCYLSDDDIRYALGGQSLSTVENEFDNWLPSLNVKFDLTDDWVLRFAASRAMSRPDFGNLRNRTELSVSLPSVGDAEDELWITNQNGDIIGADPRYQGSSRNPSLLPIKANQFDLSLEHYFSDVGSFSVALFYKEFEDYIQYSRYTTDFTINGVTREVTVRGPINGDGASIQGVELAYQQFFDFLPSPLDGFGVQANYTYIENQGIENSGPQDGGGTEQFSGATIQVDALEGLSEQAYNLVGMYEKGPFAARLAYNWRSEYLVTVIDCCVAYPVWNEDQGYLDGSLRYRLNDNFEFSLQAQNLLNTETVTEQQVLDQDEGGLRLPTGRFQRDTNVTIGVRFKY